MKNHRTLSITVLTIVAVAALLGFGITLSFSAQGALARIVIDVGVLVAVAFALTMVPKPRELRCDDVADAMREVARGRYHKRLNDAEFAELQPIAQAFNEMTGTLADTHKAAEDALRYQVPVRNDLLGRGMFSASHSIHPELGPVQTLEAFVEHQRGIIEKKSSKNASATDAIQTVLAAANSADAYSAGLTDGAGEPSAEEAVEPSEGSDVMELSNQADLSAPESSETEVTDVTAVAQDVMQTFEQMIPELYKQFEHAHEVYQRRPISFTAFESTVSQAREELIRSHQCRDVRFEVVLESGEVALRPKLLR